MGKRSDRRRREKQRARERARQVRAGSAGARAGAPGRGRAFTPDLVDGVIESALSSWRAHDGRALDNAVTVLARGPSGADGPAAVDRALGRHLLDAVGNVWGRGWQPADLVRVVERQLGRGPGRLATVAVVRETRRYEPGSVPSRWRAQVDDLDPGDGHGAAAGSNGPAAGAGERLDLGLDVGPGDGTDGADRVPGDAADDSRWVVASQAGHAGDRQAAIRTAVETLAFVGRLPDVPKLGPAPGDAPTTGAGAAGGGRGGGVDPRMLHRVRSLLAKAESTTFPDEAEALTAKAQELMARHAIDAAVLDAERGTGPQVAGRRVAVDDPYAGPKAMLLDAIASANRCRSVWSKSYGYATVFGAEADLDAVELLYTSLLVQAARAMLAEGGGPAGGRRASGRTRSFRQSFLVAFATRIGTRLREAVDAATDAYADQHDSLLPVLAERRDAADAACDEAFPRVRSTSVSANDWWGWQAGNEAAEAAQLDVHAPVGQPNGASGVPRPEVPARVGGRSR